MADGRSLCRTISLAQSSTVAARIVQDFLHWSNCDRSKHEHEHFMTAGVLEGINDGLGRAASWVSCVAK